jgi:hypothetical protein
MQRVKDIGPADVLFHLDISWKQPRLCQLYYLSDF